MTTIGTVAALLALYSAQGAGPPTKDRVSRHLAAWVHRCEFVGFVRPVEASETIWLDVVEPHADLTSILGPDGQPIPPNEDGEIPLGKDTFREIRCEVERVIKGPQLSEIKVLSYATDLLPTQYPRPLPATLEAGQSILVFLVAPDDSGRLETREEYTEFSPEGHFGECHVVRPRPGVWGMLNTETGSYHILHRPDGGWPVTEQGPPLRALLECLLKGLSDAKDPGRASAFAALLGFGSPGEFEGLSANVPKKKLAALRATALWPDYDTYCRSRVAPALRAWVDNTTDEYHALHGLSVLLQYSPSRELAEEYLSRLVARARKGVPGCTTGVTTAIWLLAWEERENLWLRLLDASLPDPGWTRYAVAGLAGWATAKSIPDIKRALREEYDVGTDMTYLRNCRHEIHLSAMRMLAKLCNDPEHAPPAQFVGNEAEEMWEPGGRLAELLEYWRNTP